MMSEDAVEPIEPLEPVVPVGPFGQMRNPDLLMATARAVGAMRTRPGWSTLAACWRSIQV